MSRQCGSVLYLGVDPKQFKTEKRVIHLPLVEVIPRPIDALDIRQVFTHIDSFTHIIFTSKSGVRIFFHHFHAFEHSLDELKKKYIIAIGHLTGAYIKDQGVIPTYIESDETGEGVIRVLSSLDLNGANVLLPRSSTARPLLTHFLVEHEIRHQVCILYDTYKRRPYEIPDLNEVDEIVFTSPSTVDEFFEIYQEIPSGKKLRPIGLYTREMLRLKLQEQSVAIK